MSLVYRSISNDHSVNAKTIFWNAMKIAQYCTFMIKQKNKSLCSIINTTTLWIILKKQHNFICEVKKHTQETLRIETNKGANLIASAANVTITRLS